MKTAEKKIKSHFGFDQHWNELPEYEGYVPAEYINWQFLKDLFYHNSEKYGPEKPLTVNIRKGNNIIAVNVYGFKVPDPPMVICLGTPAATYGRVVFCKTMKKEFIAIAW
ncbi:MAG: hypothetical protein WC875_02980 [Candidatus Absconditabacterales bacterium]|jgi:hypothetical protein